MFAHPRGLIKGLVTLVCAFALISSAGCGSDESTTTSGATQTPPTGSESPATGPGEGATAAADPDDLEVIRGWSETLSKGDVEGAADYFAFPSTAVNGPEAVVIRSTEDAVAFNASLPCGAEVIAAKTEDDLTVATFELSDRPGGGCGPGVGGEAATSFKIEDGKIVEWRRVGLPPGGGGGGNGATGDGSGGGAPV